MDIKPLLPPITVNGVTIATERIAAEAQNHPAPKEKPGLAWKAAARALAMRELMLQEARARGIIPAPTEIAPGQVETDEEALIRQLLDDAITPEPALDDQLRAHYDAHPDRFRAPTLYEAAHILFAAVPDDGAARTRARDEARAVRNQLSQSPQRFGELARSHSACSSKDNGGLLGQLTTGDTVPEFESALDSLHVSEITPDPVETRFGFHIIRLDARVRGQVLPFESVLPRLREAEEKAAWLRAARAFSTELAARATVTGVSLVPA